jgi:hypothetical protein
LFFCVKHDDFLEGDETREYGRWKDLERGSLGEMEGKGSKNNSRSS